MSWRFPFQLPFDAALLVPPAYVLVGWLLGIVVERIVVGRLRKWAEKTDWEGDDILLDALRGLTKWFGGLAGLHLALYSEVFPAGLAAVLRKGTLLGAVFAATVCVARVAGGFVSLYTRGVEGALHSTSIFRSLTLVAVYSVGVLIGLQSIGISIAPILTALGVGGLATALALQPTLANLFSGIQIIASRTINPGDFVRLDSGDEGYVVDINWRTTTIRSLPNSLILVPNSRMSNAVVTNHNYPDREIATGVSGQVAYGTDLDRVEAIVAAVGQEVQEGVAGGVPEFRPVARFTTFADSGIGFTVGLRAKEYTDQFLLKHEFVKRLDARFRAEGIEMPYPHLELVRRD